MLPNTDALLNVLSSKSGMIPTQNGKIWFRLVGDSNRIPVVTLHGGPGFPHDYLEPLEVIGLHRPILFYDQLGCGRSDRPKGTDLWTCNSFVEELEHVRKALKIEKWHLLGSSWGAMLAMDYYLAYPEHVRSMVFQSPCLSAPEWAADAKRLCQEMGPEWLAITEKHETEGTTSSPEYMEAKKKFAARFICRLPEMPLPLNRSQVGFGNEVYQTMWGPSEFSATGNLKDYDRTRELRNTRVPVLFTCGRYDEATPETVSRQAALAPDSQLVIFEKSAHCSTLEESALFIETVTNFWNTVDSKDFKSCNTK